MLWTSKTSVDVICELVEKPVASWKRAYRGILPDTLLRSLSEYERAMPWMWMPAGSESRSSYDLLKRDSRIIGYIGWGQCRETAPKYEDVGEIYGVYVYPEEQRKGIGRRVIENALKGLRSKGFAEVRIWMPAQSARARHVCEGLKFEITSMVKSMVMGGAIIPLVCYQRAL